MERFAAAPWHSRVQQLLAKQVLLERRCAGWVSSAVGAGVTSGSQEKTPLLSLSFQQTTVELTGREAALSISLVHTAVITVSSLLVLLCGVLSWLTLIITCPMPRGLRNRE